MRVGLLLGLLVGVLVAGCIAPGSPPGWERDAETGVLWRPLTPEEMATPQFEDFERVYLFRVPGAIEALQTEPEVALSLRAHGGFVDMVLVHAGESLTGARLLDSPGGSGFVNGEGFVRFSARVDGWTYDVSSVLEEFGLFPDARSADLVNRVRSPCVEMSSPGGNASATCLRHATLEGY